MTSTDQFDAGKTQNFRFVARDALGAKKSGSIAARDKQEVIDKLRQQGLFPVAAEIKAAEVTTETSASTLFQLPTSSKLTNKLIADMIARLAVLMGRRITLDRALGIMAEGDDGVISTKASDMRTRLREGIPFSEVLNEAGITDGTTLALVRGSEESGDLGTALSTAADILRERLELNRRVISGLAYPTLLLLLAVISVGFIMIFIIPQFRPLVEDRFDLVPPLGRMVFGLSNILATLWPLILLGMVAFIGALVFMARRGLLTEFLQKIAERTPFIERVIRRNRVTMFLSGLAALLQRDVILSVALRVMTRTTQSSALQASLETATREVEGGKPLYQALKETNAFTGQVIEVIRIGEEAGELADMVARSAEDMKDQADRDLERALMLLQPILIIVVGFLIGVSLYALFSAIVSVNQITF
ncbi:MAG: type II secretion system F family protein [Pseudomonadota bacterium]